MRRRNIVATLLAAGVALGTAVGSPAAVAAQCQYVARDLPLPSGMSSAEAVAATEDNSVILGQGSNGRGVIWRNGVVEPMAAPTRNVRVTVTGINSHGVVVGHEINALGPSARERAVRYVNGSYGWLFTGPDENSRALGINDHGDVVGIVSKTASPSDWKVVVWRQNQIRYQSFGPGIGVAITPNRKVITAEGELISIADRSRVNLGNREPFVVDNNRIFSWGFSSISEWDLDGRWVRSYDKGVEPLGVNSHGTLFGGFGIGSWVPGLWRNGEWTAIQADKQPTTYPFGDVTDDEVLIGNYRNGSTPRAARWFCTQ